MLKLTEGFMTELKLAFMAAVFLVCLIFCMSCGNLLHQACMPMKKDMYQVLLFFAFFALFLQVLFFCYRLCIACNV